MHMDCSALKNPQCYGYITLHSCRRKAAENPARAVFWETDIGNKNNPCFDKGSTNHFRWQKVNMLFKVAPSHTVSEMG